MPPELRLSRLGGRVWAALIEDGRPVELHIEPDSHEAAWGRLYRARVVDLRPDLDLAFVDLGTGVTAALKRTGRAQYAVGTALVVQVTREASGGKGPRVRADPLIAGRLVALAQGGGGVRLARRIRDTAERRRLDGLLGELEGAGTLVARAAAAGARPEALAADVAAQRARWSAVRRAAAAAKAPQALDDGTSWLDRLLDGLPSTTGRIVAGEPMLADAVRAWIARRGVGNATETHCATDGGRDNDDLLLAAAGATLRREVGLAGGGRLIVEPTAALVAIDVDSAGSRASALAIDLEALAETARQLRLRELGGPVVVDLLDVSPARHTELLRAADDALAADRARCRVGGLDEDGLLRLVRGRERRPLAERLTDVCEACGTTAAAPSAVLIAARVDGAVRRFRARHGRMPRRVRLHPHAADRLRRAVRAGTAHDGLPVEADPSLPERAGEPEVDE